MQIVFSIVVLIVGLYMFVAPRHIKLGFFLISTMCFSLVVIPVKGLSNAYVLLSVCFILSEFKRISFHIKSLKKARLLLLMILMIFATIVLFLNSPHYQSLKGLFILIITELIIKYFVIAYSFVALTKESDLYSVYKISLVGLSILTFFALINLMSGYSDFVDMMVSGRDVATAMDKDGVDLGSRYVDTGRFRVQGMFLLAFDYGYVCSIFFLFYLYGLLGKFVTKGMGLYAMTCCLFGVITCNCRTILASLLVSLVAFFYFCYGKSISKYLIFLFISALLIYVSSSDINNYVNDKILSMFEYNGGVEGSSIAMRVVQYLAVMPYVEGHELFGRGLDFFNIDLGWKEGIKVDESLEGIEGILLNLLLERGIVGIVFWATFYIIIFMIIKKNKIFDIKMASFGMSCIIFYMLYANMTGEMGCVFPTLLILGIALKGLYLQKVVPHKSVIGLREKRVG